MLAVCACLHHPLLWEQVVLLGNYVAVQFMNDVFGFQLTDDYQNGEVKGGGLKLAAGREVLVVAGSSSDSVGRYL